MLSYRHAFHAGNFADILKHSVLTLILNYMCRKEKGFSYIDSHAGAGIYQLSHDHAQKTGEYKNGIAKLINTNDLPVHIVQYINLINEINNHGALSIYLGSPGIAKQILRRQDNAHLFDLHPTDFTYLTEYCQHWKKSFVKQSDGYQGILALLPPPSRRGVILIDPSYELKSDYKTAINTLIKAYQKFATGTYIVWYPVVKRILIDEMQQHITTSALKNVLQVEFCLTEDTLEYGMTGSGLFIINPPWQLAEQLAEILSYLKNKIGNKQTNYILKQLVNE